MQQGRTLILVLIAFIVGFLLREMLHGITDDRFQNKDLKHYLVAKEVAQINDNRPVFEFVRLDIPQKVMRGSYFEMFGDFKRINDLDGDYIFGVTLISLDSKAIINTGSLPISKNNIPLRGQEKRFAFKVLTPDGIPLGRYAIFVDLFKAGIDDKEKRIFVPYFNMPQRKSVGNIEVVSYHSAVGS